MRARTTRNGARSLMPYRLCSSPSKNPLILTAKKTKRALGCALWSMMMMLRWIVEVEVPITSDLSRSMVGSSSVGRRSVLGRGKARSRVEQIWRRKVCLLVLRGMLIWGAVWSQTCSQQWKAKCTPRHSCFCLSKIIKHPYRVRRHRRHQNFMQRRVKLRQHPPPSSACCRRCPWRLRMSRRSSRWGVWGSTRRRLGGSSNSKRPANSSWKERRCEQKKVNWLYCVKKPPPHAPPFNYSLLSWLLAVLIDEVSQRGERLDPLF